MQKLDRYFTAKARTGVLLGEEHLSKCPGANPLLEVKGALAGDRLTHRPSQSTPSGFTIVISAKAEDWSPSIG